MNRRSFLNAAVAGGGGILAVNHSALFAGAFSPEDKPAVLGVAELITPETSKAIRAGLAYLAKRQVRDGRYEGAFGTGGYASGVAVTALAGLAFMCSGSTPLDGKYSVNIRRCIKYILSCCRETGYIAAANESHSSNMYGHGYAMLFLSQVYGMGFNKSVKQKLSKAIKMTCEIQNREGGWRYQPRALDADLSITICQIMAMRAAHSAGFDVSNEVREKTLEYVESCQNKNGSFNYMKRGGRKTVALAAAGVVSYYSAGIYEGERVEKALKWIFDRRPGHANAREVSPMNYYYAHYYAVQAMWHAQIQAPHYWNAWFPAIRDELVNSRMAQPGIWPDQRVGPEFGTAMSCIILQMPYNILPVFSP